MTIKKLIRRADRSSRIPGTPSLQVGTPLILDGVVRFAFDVFREVSHCSSAHLRLATRPRPHFHPTKCPVLMTADMKRMFLEHWEKSEEVHLVYLLFNVPRVHKVGEFLPAFLSVWNAYRNHGFSVFEFTEFLFCIAYWSLVIKQRREWVGAPDFVLELIITFTRHVLDEGGFDRCRVWPKIIKIRGMILEVGDVFNLS